MGQQESSLPQIPNSQVELVFEYGFKDSLPYFIPDNIRTITASFNSIRNFPTTLNNLESLNMSHNSLSEVDLDSIKFDYKCLKHLNLSYNGLKKTPRQIKNFMNLVNLNLDHNEIEETDDENEIDFSSLINLKNLDLFLNHIKFFPKIPESLMRLNIGFNSVKVLSISSQKLTNLLISGNEIHEIDENISLPSLTYLDISINKLIEMPPISKFAPKIETLICSFNFIEKLPSDIPSTLICLNISHNELKQAESFESIVNLKELDISYNHLKSLPKLPNKLEKFNAEHNEMNEVTKVTTKNLNVLQLNSNKFIRLPDIKDSHISYIYIRDNHLQTLETSNICNFIKKIDITNNKIEEIPNELYNFKKIQYLGLSNNRIKMISPEISLMNLTSLFISENNISELPPLPKGLTTLSASKCNFTSIPQTIYEAPRLNFVDLSINQITEIKKFPNIHTLNLSMNMIRTIPQLSDRLSNLDLSHNDLRSIELAGDYIMIQELNFSNNHIRHFSVPQLHVLHTLKISHNKHLHYNIEFSFFPSLKVLDITNTKISVTFPLPKIMRDFSTSNELFYKEANSPYAKLFSCNAIGYAETIGLRPTMEDTLILRQNFMEGFHLLAVIDGHGGSETAALAAHYIPEMLSKLNKITISSLSQILRRLNKKLHKIKVKDGAAIVLTIATKTEIGVAHLGDSRALIVRKDKSVVPLTLDHKPAYRSEIELVKENRSYVEGNRIAGILAITRSIGDFNVPGVSCIPDLNIYKRTSDDYRLVLGCDGIFDVLDNNQIGEIVTSIENINLSACFLRNIAFSRGSQDNISAVVADIQLPL